eukprot:COSAG06_NODE_6907_length_2722_cov_1.445292_2_plen_93_part_00
MAMSTNVRVGQGTLDLHLSQPQPQPPPAAATVGCLLSLTRMYMMLCAAAVVANHWHAIDLACGTTVSVKWGHVAVMSCLASLQEGDRQVPPG